MWKWLGIAAVVLVVANFTGFDPIGSLREGLFGLEQRPEAAAVTLAAIHKTSELRTASGEFSVPVTFGQEQSGAVHEVLPMRSTPTRALPSTTAASMHWST